VFPIYNSAPRFPPIEEKQKQNKIHNYCLWRAAFFHKIPATLCHLGAMLEIENTSVIDGWLLLRGTLAPLWVDILSSPVSKKNPSRVYPDASTIDYRMCFCFLTVRQDVAKPSIQSKFIMFKIIFVSHIFFAQHCDKFMTSRDIARNRKYER